MKKHQLPEEVPILTASDFCKGDFVKSRSRKSTIFESSAEQEDYYDDKVTCCLLGHANTVFHESQYARSKAKQAVFEVIKKEHPTFTDGIEPIHEFNDAKHIPLKIIASVWNKAMQKLGYNVPLKYTKPENCK